LDIDLEPIGLRLLTMFWQSVCE